MTTRTPNYITADDLEHYLAAMALPWNKAPLKAYEAAWMAYKCGVELYNKADTALERAERNERPAFDKAVADLVKLTAKGESVEIPHEITAVVVEAEAATTMAKLRERLANDAVNNAHRQLSDAFQGLGLEGIKWCATHRVKRGPDGAPDEHARWVWAKLSPTYLVPYEALEHPLAKAYQASDWGHNNVPAMSRGMHDYPLAVGPTSANHPQRHGRVINGNHEEISPDALNAYDHRRHHRLVAYWAMCAIASDMTSLNRDGQLVITADWRDHLELMSKFPPKRMAHAGMDKSPDDDYEPGTLQDPKPKRWRGMAGTSIIMDQ